MKRKDRFEVTDKKAVKGVIKNINRRSGRGPLVSVRVEDDNMIIIYIGDRPTIEAKRWSKVWDLLFMYNKGLTAKLDKK